MYEMRKINGIMTMTERDYNEVIRDIESAPLDERTKTDAINKVYAANGGMWGSLARGLDAIGVTLPDPDED